MAYYVECNITSVFGLQFGYNKKENILNYLVPHVVLVFLIVVSTNYFEGELINYPNNIFDNQD